VGGPAILLTVPKTAISAPLPHISIQNPPIQKTAMESVGIHSNILVVKNTYPHTENKLLTAAAIKEEASCLSINLWLGRCCCFLFLFFWQGGAALAQFVQIAFFFFF